MFALAVNNVIAVSKNTMSTARSLTSKYDVLCPVFSIPLTSTAQESSSAVLRLLNSIGTSTNSIVLIGWMRAARFDVYKPFSFIASMIMKRSSLIRAEDLIPRRFVP